MEFFCENPAAGHADDRIWKGYVKQLRRHGDTVEADISGKRERHACHHRQV